MTFTNICRKIKYEDDDNISRCDDLYDIWLQLCSWIREKVSRQNDTQAKQNRRRNINNI